MLGNPVDGMKRPASNNNEGSTPALGDAQVRRLLEAAAPDTLRGVRDRAILATLLYPAFAVKSCVSCACVTYSAGRASCIFASRASATKFGLFPFARWRCGLSVSTWKAAKHDGRMIHENLDSPLLRPVVNNRTGTLDQHLDLGSIYRNTVMKYAKLTGIAAEAVGMDANVRTRRDGALWPNSGRPDTSRHPRHSPQKPSTCMCRSL